MIEKAKKIAIQAGRKVLLLRKRSLTFTSKKRIGDFATEADLFSEEIILSELRKYFPSHNFISEEAGKLDNGSEYTWVIDPLDGTIPYSSGLPIFGISIGLLKNLQPQLGVINMPEERWLVWAEKAKGAYGNGKRLKVSKKNDLKECVVAVEYGYMGSRRVEAQKLLLPIIDNVRYPPALASSVASCAYVGAGVLMDTSIVPTPGILWQGV